MKKSRNLLASANQPKITIHDELVPKYLDATNHALTASQIADNYRADNAG